MKTFLTIALGMLLLGCDNSGNNNGEPPPGPGPGPGPGPEPPIVETGTVNSDLWAATDPLGRKLPDFGEVGAKKSNKTVAMFYWTWHCQQQVQYGNVGNVSEILRLFPNAINEKDNPVWDRGGSITHFWGEPLFGYYRTTDPWVLRKHAEMLADAGVDAVFFDCTNAPFLWEDSYNALLQTWDQARKDGVKVPKVSFLLPFAPTGPSYEMIKKLYDDLYSANRYPELWFYWKGKPALMAYPDNIPDTAEGRAIRSFFTFRPGQPDYVDGPNPSRNDQWAWLEIYPQHSYIGNEQMAVGVAQNTSPDRGGHAGAFNVEDSYGRSFTYKNGFDGRDNAYLYGANFQEQWDLALDYDPELIFVTGWNEYIMGKWDRGTPEGDVWNGYPFSFVDQFDWDRSRDIEPNNEWYDNYGNYLGDTYYYQLIENVRKYKGMSQPVFASEEKSINIGSFEDWEDVEPVYNHYLGNTMNRSHQGHADKYYTDNSGRNDIIGARVSRDDSYIYFYVCTAENITEPVGNNWMWLLINIDRERETGWEGYDFILNYDKPEKSTGKLFRNIGNDWEWEECGSYDYAVKENHMELKIEKSILGLSNEIDFEFKWADNMPVNVDFNISYFYKYGDAAPGGRFNFVYTVE